MGIHADIGPVYRQYPDLMRKAEALATRLGDLPDRDSAVKGIYASLKEERERAITVVARMSKDSMHRESMLEQMASGMTR